MRVEGTASGRIAIVLHGGAGDIPEEERGPQKEGLERALGAGWDILVAGGSALDAVEESIRILEDDPLFDAGVGSVLRLDGSVSMDASIMDGVGLRAGAAAGLSRVRHPISLARHILEATNEVFLIAPGAEALARQAGLELREPEFFVTPRERARLEAILREGGRARAGEASPGASPGPCGTVGAVARDSAGRLAAGTSTGGAPGAPPGRVGDTPIIGAGTYCDVRAGGVSCTGRGENMIRTTLAREVVRALERGLSPGEAASWAVEHLAKETQGTCGLICMSHGGECAAAYSTGWMGSVWRVSDAPASRSP